MNTNKIILTSPETAHALAERSVEAERELVILHVGMAWVNGHISREQATEAAAGLVEAWVEERVK